MRVCLETWSSSSSRALQLKEVSLLAPFLCGPPPPFACILLLRSVATVFAHHTTGLPAGHPARTLPDPGSNLSKRAVKDRTQHTSHTGAVDQHARTEFPPCMRSTQPTQPSPTHASCRGIAASSSQASASVSATCLPHLVTRARPVRA